MILVMLGFIPRDRQYRSHGLYDNLPYGSQDLSVGIVVLLTVFSGFLGLSICLDILVVIWHNTGNNSEG